MDKIIIKGGQRLKGEVAVSGSKNAALPILIASLLTPEACFFEAVPKLADIRTTFKLLSGLGVRVDRERWDASGGELKLQAD